MVTPEVLNEMSQVFGGLPSNDMNLRAKYSPYLLSAIADESCYPRETFSNLRIVDSTSDYIRNIDEGLQKGKIVGVGLISDSIESGLAITEMEGHAVSIVGRRFNPATERCEYLVRNSSGPAWADGGYKYVQRDHLISGVTEAVYLDQK